MYRGLQRFRTSSSSIVNRVTVPQLRIKASNSWSAIQDTYYSTKDIFERHKVVFTISTSIASVATAWFGYTLRHLHESRVDQRLESIEKAEKEVLTKGNLKMRGWVTLKGVVGQVTEASAGGTLPDMNRIIWMKNDYQIEDPEFKKLVSGSISVPACVATAGTTLILGYALGFRGGKWYANRKFRREQMKLLGQIKPKRWPLRFLRRPLIKSKSPENLVTASETSPKGASASHS